MEVVIALRENEEEAHTRTMVVHNEAESRFEMKLGGGEIAVLEYRRTADSMFFTHTFVPTAYEGRGYATELAQAGLDYARAVKLQIVPHCSFISKFIRRNPEYLPSVPEAYRGAAPSCQFRQP
jgi:predicted GNAT family acetyltransferase